VIEWDPRKYRWKQVADIVEQRISDGTYGPHHRITELDLADELGVARETVRRALVDLRKRGIIVTLLGRGSFPAASAPERQGGDADEDEQT
jgi:Transcriptional regulators